MRDKNTPRHEHHYYTTTMDEIGLDRRIIAVQVPKHDDLLIEMGWTRVLYRDLSRHLTDPEIRKVKWGDCGAEHRKGILNGTYTFHPTGRTINDIADEWADLMDKLDDADKARQDA